MNINDALDCIEYIYELPEYWQKDSSYKMLCVLKNKYKFSEAKKYSKNNDILGYTDWRLPTEIELKDISYCIDVYGITNMMKYVLSNTIKRKKNKKGIVGVYICDDVYHSGDSDLFDSECELNVILVR